MRSQAASVAPKVPGQEHDRRFVSAKARATAPPIPDAAPVTTTTIPERVMPAAHPFRNKSRIQPEPWYPRTVEAISRVIYRPAHLTLGRRFIQPLAVLLIAFGACVSSARAQIDPFSRNLVELGYDQPLAGHGPAAAYLYYYYNKPDYFGKDIDLRAAIAPAYLDSELGFKHLISPYTDVGLGLSGGAFGDNFYDVSQGKYLETQSFYGSGGGTSVSIYQLLDPGFLIPLNLFVRGGLHYSTYFETPQTSSAFKLPEDQLQAYTLVGLRFAGKQPVLLPALGLEISVWFQREHNFHADTYGFDNERSISPYTDLYWVYAGLDYEFKNSGDRFSLAITAGGETNPDLFSAWRMGGELPLVTEFPLMIPGYYYDELTAVRFVHFYGSYGIPLDEAHRWDLRIEAATARLDYLPGFEQNSDWQTGAGLGLTYAPRRQNYKIVLRYGYGFNAIRKGREGAQSVGVLFQYDLNARKKPKALPER
jgi:hypothetical protein